MEPEKPLHDFEKRGLGLAPFVFVRPHRRAEASGTCARCGKAIKFECIVRSADGRESTIGRECIRRLNDWQLQEKMEAEFRRLNVEEMTAKVQRMHELLKDDKVTAALAAKPHPWPYRAKLGQTLLAYVRYVIDNGELPKRALAAGYVVAAAKECGFDVG